MTGRKRLGELLVEAGEIDQMQLQAALGHQKQWGGRLGDVVVQMGFTTEERMVKTLSRQLDIPLADFPDPIHARVLAEVPREMAEQWGVIPLGLKRDSRGETLYIAMSDPTNYDAIDALQFKTGKRIAPMLAGDSKLQQLIRRYHHGERTIDLLPTVAVAAAAAQMQVQFSGLEVDLAAAELPTVTGSPLPPPAQAGALFEQTGSFLGDGGDDVATADEMLGRLAAPAIEDDPFSGISVEVPDGADVLNAPRKNGPDPTEAAPVSAADLGLILTPADAVVPTPAWVTQAVDVVPGGNIDVGPSASVEPPAPPMHDGEEVLQLTLEADGEADAEADADDDAAVDADDPAKLEPPQLDVATGAAASVSLAIEVALTSPAAVATPWTEGLPVASLELSDPLHIGTDRDNVAGFDVPNTPLISDADAVDPLALPPPSNLQALEFSSLFDSSPIPDDSNSTRPFEAEVNRVDDSMEVEPPTSNSTRPSEAELNRVDDSIRCEANESNSDPFVTGAVGLAAQQAAPWTGAPVSAPDPFALDPFGAQSVDLAWPLEAPLEAPVEAPVGTSPSVVFPASATGAFPEAPKTGEESLPLLESGFDLELQGATPAAEPASRTEPIPIPVPDVSSFRTDESPAPSADLELDVMPRTEPISLQPFAGRVPFEESSELAPPRQFDSPTSVDIKELLIAPQLQGTADVESFIDGGVAAASEPAVQTPPVHVAWQHTMGPAGDVATAETTVTPPLRIQLDEESDDLMPAPGVELSPALANVPAQPRTLAPVPMEATVDVAVTELTISTCGSCQNPRVPGAKFCPFCGTSFLSTSTQREPAVGVAQDWSDVAERPMQRAPTDARSEDPSYIPVSRETFLQAVSGEGPPAPAPEPLADYVPAPPVRVAGPAPWVALAAPPSDPAGAAAGLGGVTDPGQHHGGGVSADETLPEDDATLSAPPPTSDTASLIADLDPAELRKLAERLLQKHQLTPEDIAAAKAAKTGSSG